MVILALEAISNGYSISISKSNKIYNRTSQNQEDTRELIPVLQELLTESNVEIHEISKILTITGHGSYTGIRIAMSIIKGLVFSRSIPILTIDSLDYLSLLNSETAYLHTKGSELVTQTGQKTSIQEITNTRKNRKTIYTNKNKLFENYVLNNELIEIKALPFQSEMLIEFYNNNSAKYKILKGSIYG